MKFVVIGSGMGGLSAAIHARLRGAEVLVVEARERAGGKAALIEAEGYRFDPGPSIIILIRLYRALFEAASKNLDEYVQFRRLDPMSRVLFQGETLDLPGDRAEAIRFLKGRSPRDGAAFEALMNRLDRASRWIDQTVFARPYEKWSDLLDWRLAAFGFALDPRKTYREMVDSWFESPMLRAFFYGFPSYGGQTYDSKAPGALMIPYLMLQEGVFWPVGGVSAIPEALYRLAIELGVEFRFSSPVRGLGAHSGRVSEVVLDDETLRADAVISNVDRQATLGWLGEKFDAAPSLSYFTLQWGLRKPLPKVSHHTLVVPEHWQEGFEQLYRKREFPVRPIVYLNETAKTEPSMAPAGCSNLFAVVTSPAETGAIDWGKETDEYRLRVLGVLAEAGIEIRPDEIAFERVQTPTLFRERDGAFRGSLYGVDESARPLGGMFPFPNRSAYAGLYFAGGSVQPGAGLPMACLSGRFAAELAISGR